MDIFSTKIAYAGLNEFIGKVSDKIINPLILLMFAVAMVYFLFGALQFMLNQDNEEAKTEGKSHMIWGIVGLTIMIGAWAIMGWIVNTFGLNYIDVDDSGNYNVEKLSP